MKNLLCSLMLFSLASLPVMAFAVPHRGLPVGKPLQLVGIDKQHAKEGRTCGKYFVLTKDFHQTLFMWDRGGWYSDRTEVTVIVDQSVHTPTVTFEQPYGRYLSIIRMSNKEAKRAQPCLPAPSK
ncbi:MAG: hypothetical protein NUV90_00165 [Candidatus Parcubacteria bacterium]|nr:hypothetical protein [Candidatus Parcubacteria bacterium]